MMEELLHEDLLFFSKMFNGIFFFFVHLLFVKSTADIRKTFLESAILCKQRPTLLSLLCGQGFLDIACESSGPAQATQHFGPM